MQGNEGQISFPKRRGADENAISGYAGCNVKMDRKNPQLGTNPASAVGILPG